jgi:DNA-binding winged helix-turn-helix (wHTH) protein
MLTAHGMRELNTKIKLQRADQTAKEISVGAYSDDVLRALKYVSDAVQDRLSEGLPYRDNTLTVNITRIRKKLEAAGVNDFITTKRGLGYLVGA